MNNLFSRFLTPERISMPDIDIDVRGLDSTKREKIRPKYVEAENPEIIDMMFRFLEPKRDFVPDIDVYESLSVEREILKKHSSFQYESAKFDKFLDEKIKSLQNQIKGIGFSHEASTSFEFGKGFKSAFN